MFRSAWLRWTCWLLAIAAACWLVVGLLSWAGAPAGERAAAIKTLRLPMPTDGPKSLDPVKGSTAYDIFAGTQVYETLLQYKYLVRPPALEPLLLAEMPHVSDDGLTWRFKLKRSVFFHDDPCFPDGKGRELVTDDVFYSWKRMADDKNLPKSWSLFENTIVGFDQYRKRQNAAKKFDYDRPVKGLRKIDDHEFAVVLTEPIQRFAWELAMYQLAVVPREAVERYGDRFGRHPVGTGPFTMAEEDWRLGQLMVFKKNPNYHACYYPNEHNPEDEKLGLDKAAGTRLPIADRMEIRMFVETQPMWLRFGTGQLDFTTVPAEYYPQAFIKRLHRLRPNYVEAGVTFQSIKLLDLIFIGFNMEDPLLGGYDQKQKDLRHALSLAMDWEERNETFYNGLNVIYDGPIPPGLDGYPPDGVAPHAYRGPNVEKARELLAKAGYVGGEGLEPLDYYTARGANAEEQEEMFARQLKKIGVRLDAKLVEFSTLIEAVSNKKAPMFSFAWGADYPDAENFLAIFYSPNKTPGPNSFNYKRPEFDELYEKIRTMPPSPERTKIYEQMRDMIIEDSPFLGSMGRERFYLIHPRLKNFKPSEDFSNWPKYLDVDDSQKMMIKE